MIRSMYSAVSGLRSHQTMMDVVGNNIANVNTHGFKKSRTTFADVLSQVVNGAATPTEVLGGTNPAQIGLGVTVSGIAQNLAQGALQVTDRNLDVSIQGDGFFLLSLAGEQMFTRNGAFFVDADGRLVTDGGGLVQGWVADGTGEINTSATATTIRIPTGDQHPPVVTDEIKFGGNLPADAAIGDVLFSGLEIFDLQGATVVLDVTYEKTADNEWTVSATYGDAQTPVVVTDNVLTFGADGEMTAPADFDMNIAAGQIPDVGHLLGIDGSIGLHHRVQRIGHGLRRNPGIALGRLTALIASAQRSRHTHGTN
jgi:flagellar hook protein FlgE